MPRTLNYRERALECLTLAQITQNPQTKMWATEFAALLQRLSHKKAAPFPANDRASKSRRKINDRS
jgi:hypothetical protein